MKSSTETSEMLERIVQKQLSVLFVEDNSEIREIMSKSLPILFNNVDIVEDGKQALVLLDSNNYDLVITDINMPNVDGADLIKRIRSRCKLFPIIITTAHIEFADIYKNQPNIIIINKPYSVFEIVEALEEFEEKHSVVEDNVYEKLDKSYSEARKVLDLINKRFKG